MKANRKSAWIGASAAVWLAASAAQAATIAWTVSNVTGPADISTTGTLVVAKSGAQTTPASITVAGVPFAAGQIYSPQSNYDNITTRVPSFGLTGENLAYTTMLQYAARNGAITGYHTISFSDLTIGQEYQIQIWVTDTALAGRAVVLNDGSGAAPDAATPGHASLQYQVTGGTWGQYALGTFTADATSQSLYLKGKDGAANYFTLVNGLQLRSIPEPSTALLGGLGLLALLRRRR